MDISLLILSWLIENGSATVPGFGTFYLKKIDARYSNETDTLLPPAKEVYFSPDYDLADSELSKSLSESAPAEEIEKELARQTTYWKNMLNAAEPFEIAGLGKFLYNDNEMHFYGEKIFSESPDFYGLEEIPISNLKKKTRKGSNFWPAALSLAAIGTIAAITCLNPELLFGKKSFPERAHTEKAGIKKLPDSAKAVIKEEALRDSAVQSSKSAPRKPIYRKKIWRKARKHRSH